MDRFKPLFLLLITFFGSFGISLDLVSAQQGPQGRILLYTSMPMELATQFAGAFMKKMPQIKVEIYRTGSTEIERRLKGERQGTGLKADILWLADVPVYYELRNQGELMRYVSPEAENILADFRDPQGYFTAGRLINMIIAVNTEVLPLKAAPKSWKDFPDSGKNAIMGNPAYSGTSLLAVSVLVKNYGWQWLERARAKGVVVVRGNPEAARALAGKEFGISMTLDYVIFGLIKKGIPLAIVWPEDGAISLPIPIAIVKGTKNPEMSRAFVDYILSREGQELLAKQGAIPVRRDVEPPKGLPSASQIKFLSISDEWTAQNAPSILEKFDKIMFR
jgi:iron(III) transport system substrate-binding protein